MKTKTLKLQEKLGQSKYQFNKPKKYPSLFLSGKWMKDIGFEPKNDAKITYSKNKIIIETL